MRIEGGYIPEKNKLYLDKEAINALASNAPERRRKKIEIIARVTFFLKIKREGAIIITSVGTKDEIMSIIEQKLGFKQTSSLHQTEASVIQAVHKQVIEIEKRGLDKKERLKLTASFSKKDGQLLFEKIGTPEEMEEILKAKNICYKATEQHIEESRVRGEFLRSLEASSFLHIKEPVRYLF